MFLPVQAYFAGMDCPFMNASLVNSRGMLTSIVGASVMGMACVVGVAGDEHAASRIDVNAR
jgi:hypothetical protein